MLLRKYMLLRRLSITPPLQSHNPPMIPKKPFMNTAIRSLHDSHDAVYHDADAASKSFHDLRTLVLDTALGRSKFRSTTLTLAKRNSFISKVLFPAANETKKVATIKASESWFLVEGNKKRSFADDTNNAIHNTEDTVLHAASVASAAQKSIHNTQDAAYKATKHNLEDLQGTNDGILGSIAHAKGEARKSSYHIPEVIGATYSDAKHALNDEAYKAAERKQHKLKVTTKEASKRAEKLRAKVIAQLAAEKFEAKKREAEIEVAAKKRQSKIEETARVAAQKVDEFKAALALKRKLLREEADRNAAEKAELARQAAEKKYQAKVEADRLSSEKHAQAKLLADQKQVAKESSQKAKNERWEKNQAVKAMRRRADQEESDRKAVEKAEAKKQIALKKQNALNDAKRLAAEKAAAAKIETAVKIAKEKIAAEEKVMAQVKKQHEADRSSAEVQAKKEAAEAKKRQQELTKREAELAKATKAKAETEKLAHDTVMRVKPFC
ncbi:hypothetical protein BGZ96_001698 [Linnemannia gamsii]|uniref:Uncharacterized protein n=1 Tax=Linnemannia gamsii TaxID=64522 RepID=A0ABQ7JLZ8_9FUNG|nr:hypothetical protein BGZ96_001698 [Linnemannia gamsii]